VTTTVAAFIYNNFQYSRETMSNSKKTNLVSWIFLKIGKKW
jgi:hypothetical protein